MAQVKAITMSNMRHQKIACDVVPFSPLEPLSSDCGVVPLATGGGERSSAVAWSLEAGRSEIQRTRTEAHMSGYAHIYSHVSYILM